MSKMHTLRQTPITRQLDIYKASKYMDFKDWRKAANSPANEKLPTNRQPRKRFVSSIEEQILAAQERGAFDNLPGTGQPLKLDENVFAGDKAAGYSLLKSNGYAPAEIELAREIHLELARLEKSCATLSSRGQYLRHRRVPPFASEKHAFNTSVTRTLNAYTNGLYEIQRKILTLNLTTPTSMHRTPLDIEQLIDTFKTSCPLL